MPLSVRPLLSARRRCVGTATDLTSRLRLVAIGRADRVRRHLPTAVRETPNEVMLARALVGFLVMARVSAVEGLLTLRDRLFQQQLLDAIFVELLFPVGALRGLTVPIAVVPNIPAGILGLLTLGNAESALGRLRRRHFIGRSVNRTAPDGRPTADHHNHKSRSFHRLPL